MVGILFVVIGYGVYQPAAYIAAVRQFTTPKTASMAYAMLYALMNAGSSLAMMAFMLRDDNFLGLGIVGTFWVYTALTLISLLLTIFILSKKTVETAIARAKAESAALAEEMSSLHVKNEQNGIPSSQIPVKKKIPVTAWIVLAGILGAIFFRVTLNLAIYSRNSSHFHPDCYYASARALQESRCQLDCDTSIS